MSGTITTKSALLTQVASGQAAGSITPVQLQNMIASMLSAIAPRNPQTANYTLALTDVGGTVDMTNTSAATVTIPANGTVALPVNTTLWVHAGATGQVSIAGASGVTVLTRPGHQLVMGGLGSFVELEQVAANVWMASGDLLDTNASAPATMIFVATTGNDSTGTGAYTTPYATFAKALTVATSGQTVLFRGGTYTLGSTLTWSSANNGTTFMSFPGEIAIISGGGTVDLMMNMDGVSGATVRGFQFQNSGTTSPFYGCIRLHAAFNNNIIGNLINNCYNGVYLDQASWNTVQGNKITNTFGVGGVQIGGGSNNNLIDSNIIDTTTSLLGGTGTTGAGIWGANGGGNVITHNIVRNCIGAAIAMDTISTNGSMYGTVIQNNYCPNNITSASANDCGVIYLFNSSLQLNNDVLVDNNYCETQLVSTSIEAVCIYLDNYVSGVTVTNNICYMCSFGFLIHGGMNNTFKNNIVNMNNTTSANVGAGIFQNLAGFTGGSMTNNNVTGNIIYSTATSAPGAVWQGLLTPVVTISKNFYFNTHAQSMANVSGGVSDSSPFTAADPKFVAPDLTSRIYDASDNNVPGFNDFQPINQGSIGLRTSGIVHWQVGWA